MTPQTQYDPPPIPIRTWDWSAWYGDQDGDTIYGHGATETEAIADLEIALEERGVT